MNVAELRGSLRLGARRQVAAALAVMAFAATIPCAARDALRLEIVPYRVLGDEQATYQRAADLAILGKKKDALAKLRPLIERGYPAALRFEITGHWDIHLHTPLELAAGCKGRGGGRFAPVQALERLALQGDQAAIDRYINCVTSNREAMRRTDWDPRAALWLADRSARAGNWTHASDLFIYHLAGMDLRTSPQGLAAKQFFSPKDCGFRCRKPDLAAAAEVARLLETLAAADDSILPPIYYESAETLTWVFVAREDNRQASEWANITAERAARAARRNHPSAIPHLERLRATMLRVVRSNDAVSPK